MDRRKRHFCLNAAGMKLHGPPPRDDAAMHTRIRYAIANGFKEYDFSQGNEPTNTRLA